MYSTKAVKTNQQFSPCSICSKIEWSDTMWRSVI